MKSITAQLIGTRVYPKEESWKPHCPHCGKPLFVKLEWNQDACEFQLLLVEGGGFRLRVPEVKEKRPICEKCGKQKEAWWKGTKLGGYWCPNCAKKHVPRNYESTRYSTDICLVCSRIVRRDLKPDGACPVCGNKTEWKHERLYSENDT